MKKLTGSDEPRAPERAAVLDTLTQLVADVDRGADHLTDADWMLLGERLRDRLGTCPRHMSPRVVWLIGAWQFVVGSASLAAFLLVLGRFDGAGETPGTTGIVTAALLAGVMGSVVQTGIVFGARAGYRTLERGFEAWYLLRPLLAGLLAVLFSLASMGGFQLLAGPETPQGVAGFVTLGGLAGLFTDRVVQAMQTLLGATRLEVPASQQQIPSSGARPHPEVLAA